MTPGGFVGIDPRGLVALADTADQYAVRVDLARSNVAAVLDHHLQSNVAEVAGDLAAVARMLIDHSVELRWRAEIIDRANALRPLLVVPFPVGGWLAEFAASAVFNLADWQQAFTTWRADSGIERLRDMQAEEIAAAFAQMTQQEAEALARRQPAMVGSMDGAPASIRYLANDLLVRSELARLESLIARLGVSEQALSSSGPIVARAKAQAAELQRWLQEDRQILLFDAAGDGRIAEVFGDLDDAARIAVVVPGMANDMSNFSEPDGGFRAGAERIFWASAHSNVATIAWLGYDTPNGVDATARGAAAQGAPDLARFLSGVDPDGSRSITVVAHSYGSVVAGLAARDGIAADNVVFVGSPGTTLESAADAVLRPEGRVWAALAEADPIGLGIDPLDSVRWWHGLRPVVPLMAVSRSFLSKDDLWHGTNPISESFGAQRITTTGSHGHSSYFQATTLENLVLIVAGRYSEVGLVD